MWVMGMPTNLDRTLHAEHDAAQHGWLHNLKVFVLWHIAVIPKAYLLPRFQIVSKAGCGNIITSTGLRHTECFWNRWPYCRYVRYGSKQIRCVVGCFVDAVWPLWISEYEKDSIMFNSTRRKLREPNVKILYVSSKYRAIQNNCRGFNNLSYTIHLR